MDPEPDPDPDPNPAFYWHPFDGNWYNEQVTFYHKVHNHVTVFDEISLICTILYTEGHWSAEKKSVIIN